MGCDMGDGRLPCGACRDGNAAAPARRRLTQQRAQILKLATNHSLPVVSIYKDFAEAGGLLAYGSNLPAAYRRAAYYADRILKGAKPSDLPVEVPTQFDLVVNLKTAKALGLTVPPSVLLSANHVIE